MYFWTRKILDMRNNSKTFKTIQKYSAQNTTSSFTIPTDILMDISEEKLPNQIMLKQRTLN